jgi:hypothetical protein
MIETAKGIGVLLVWICLIYGAYKLLDVTGLGNAIADFLDWWDTTPPDYCGVCEPATNF